MEQHSVPQNIIDVEFKLFGSFSLNQFIKILGGVLVGFLIYLLKLPFLLALPLISVSVITGFGLAIIPLLGVWINNFIKALFISPRYVWMKDSVRPDILLNSIQEKKIVDPKVSSSLAKSKLDISQLPLDKLFGTRTGSTETLDDSIIEGSPVRGQNFSRVYEDAYGGSIKRDVKTQIINPNINTKGGVNSKPQMNVNPKKKIFHSIEEYSQEIQKLKFELSMIPKDDRYKEKEEEIMSQINEIFSELKNFENKGNEVKTNQSLIKNPIKAQHFTPISPGKVIIGIVVDKKETPVSNVDISFFNQEVNTIFKTVSSNEGKFSTVKPIPFGHYSISLSDNNLHKFHTYSLEIKEGSLTAYKFREK